MPTATLRSLILVLAPAALAALAPAAEPQSDTIESSVVKIYATVRRPDPFRPWTKASPQEITATGTVIPGKRILTNAHVVLYASEVQVQADGAGDKFSATAESVGPGIDLAVLKLEDESFFNSHPPLPQASALPAIRDAVVTYGYPVGGSGMSSTKGIVSRIEFAPYQDFTSGLRVQIDAAINPGNSGGPAMVGDRMIGLAFSHLVGNETENIGYIIPCEEIDLFLKGVATGHYAGKPAIFDEFQTLENPALRRFLKVDPSVKGVVFLRAESRDPAYPLKKWDVATQIGDMGIDDSGMIDMGNDLRLRFPYLIQRIAHDGKVSLTVVRAGKTLKLDVPVVTRPDMLIKGLSGSYPSYFIYGPIVFTTVSSEFVGSVSRNTLLSAALSALGNPMFARRSEHPAFAGEELVAVASPFFPHDLAKGYANPALKVVKTVNGVPIRNLRHLVEVLRNARGELVIFEFFGRGTESIILPRAETVAATDEILMDDDIRSQASPDLMAVWRPKSR